MEDFTAHLLTLRKLTGSSKLTSMFYITKRNKIII